MVTDVSEKEDLYVNLNRSIKYDLTRQRLPGYIHDTIKERVISEKT